MTIRFKLTMGFIAVILVLNTLLSLATIKHLGHVWMREIQNRVRLDLNSARAAYNCRTASIARFLEAASLDDNLASALAARDTQRIAEVLSELHRRGGMDMLNAVAPDGTVLFRGRPQAQTGGTLVGNPVVDQAIATGKLVAGTVLLTRENLVQQGSDLVGRAEIEPLPAPASRAASMPAHEGGMAVAAASPVVDDQGRLVGLLYGANLVNRQYDLVDAIRNQVFPHQLYGGKEVGSVTIFQNDVRIATNVLNEWGERAIGTRMGDAVYRQVMQAGQTYADEALVLNEHYITAYEPIKDPTGRIIGALYVGLLEAPFANRHNFIVTVFLVMVGAASVASLVLMFVVTKLVLRPIGGVIEMAHKVIAGDLTARVNPAPPGEMGDLCQAVNAMADAVSEREKRLKHTTNQQISNSEKLASIGRLAAGVAHEINNPLTGVLTFAHLLRQKPNMDEQDRQDLDLVIHETSRVGEIVAGLLDFARERPASKAMLDLNHIIRQTVRLIANQSRFNKITIEEHLGEHLPGVYGDRNQLQQVLLNLALNACEAMPNGGALTITTQPHGRDVMLTVADTGLGIKPEHLTQVFDPFFTTKPVGKGTGLGLSVSYGIVQQHGGVLSVQSQEGKGTVFTIIMPFGEAHDVPAEEPQSVTIHEP